MRELVIKSLERIGQMLQRDGGDVELVEINQNGVVRVKMQGACRNCPGAMMTIRMIIERQLKQEVPGITEVIGV